jgi:hypothetical protein
MMRYFFHVMDGNRLFSDEVGQTFSGVDDAKLYAAIIASELAQDCGWMNGALVLLHDEHGNEIAQLPL